VSAAEDSTRTQATGAWNLATRRSQTRISISPDGLHWKTISDDTTIGQQNETITLYRFNGRYHVGGHQISPLLRLPLQEHELSDIWSPRVFVIWRSPRIDRWPLEHTKAFFKPMRSTSPYRTGWDREEVHMGAAVTTFGNVCLGVYGQWHHPINDGKPKYSATSVSVDLGLIVSNDGLHFREPAPGYTLIGRDQERHWDRDNSGKSDSKIGGDNLLLGQGAIVNTRTQTHIYYDACAPGGNIWEVAANIGVALLDRDRFGCLHLCPQTADGQFQTCPVKIDGKARLFVNAEVPAGASLEFSITDEDGLDELPGFGPAAKTAVKESGLDVPVSWGSSRELPAGRVFRIRCQVRGLAKLFALYVR
jgi:hypothetical protein